MGPVAVAVAPPEPVVVVAEVAAQPEAVEAQALPEGAEEMVVQAALEVRQLMAALLHHHSTAAAAVGVSHLAGQMQRNLPKPK